MLVKGSRFAGLIFIFFGKRPISFLAIGLFFLAKIESGWMTKGHTNFGRCTLFLGPAP
jgi:hypothetical protein